MVEGYFAVVRRVVDCTVVGRQAESDSERAHINKYPLRTEKFILQRLVFIEQASDLVGLIFVFFWQRVKRKRKK